MRINSMCGSRNFCQGGSRPYGQKTAWTTGFSVFLVLNLFYSLQERSNGFITVKTILFQRSRGVQHFPGGGRSSFFRGGGGGVKMLISVEPHITCDFPGWSGPLSPPPLDPHMNRGAVKTDRNRSLNMRTDKHA